MRKNLGHFAWVILTAVFWGVYKGTDDNIVLGLTALASASAIIFLALRMLKTDD